MIEILVKQKVMEMKKSNLYTIFGVIFAILCIIFFIQDSVILCFVSLFVMIFCFVKSDNPRTKFPNTDEESGEKP